MELAVVSVHLFAGIIWVAALMNSLSEKGTGGTLAKRLGPPVLLTGVLLAAGSIRFDDTKSALGLYGVSVCTAVILFFVTIGVARKDRAAKRLRPSKLFHLCVFAMAGLMVFMGHWPLVKQ